MKLLLISCLAAATLGVVAASAQSTSDKPAAGEAAKPAAGETAKPVTGEAAKPAAGETAKSAASEPTESAAAAPAFVDKQGEGLVRAPKLVGVAVYDNANKSVGKIDDLLLDHDGNVKTVVIGIGGFLGIGRKDIGVPYSAIHWQTEQRTVAVNGAPPANGVTGSSAQPQEKTIEPEKIEAYQGYPDRAVLDVSQAQLKAAPDFKYASNPAARAEETGAPASNK
ncbi:MAG: PRC-barrel domain-containing protein [Pseudomonadota bacterium]|nr:PRC-barrel domain-containing protein [Pseudomonadota bacterium]